MSVTSALGKENVFKCYVNILFTTSSLQFSFYFGYLFLWLLLTIFYKIFKSIILRKKVKLFILIEFSGNFFTLFKIIVTVAREHEEQLIQFLKVRIFGY